MERRPAAPPDLQVLPDREAARLLARASELDAERRAGTPVTELRAAAAEAGISAPAFEAALAELHGARPVRDGDAPARRRRNPLKSFVVAMAVILLPLGALMVARTSVPAPATAPVSAGAPIVEEALLLRCLPAGEAAQLIRPLLRFRENSVVVAAHAPRVLTVRGTAAQLREVRVLLERYERAESPSCAAGAATTAGPR